MQLVETPFTEDQMRLSPDSAWIAFNSNESGSWEVYVARFPTFAEKRQVSNGGGVLEARRGGAVLYDSARETHGGPDLPQRPAFILWSA